MTVKHLHIQFEGANNTLLGSWNIPDPFIEGSTSSEFLAVSADIGWHIALAISRGATGCKFMILPPPPEEIKS